MRPSLDVLATIPATLAAVLILNACVFIVETPDQGPGAATDTAGDETDTEVPVIGENLSQGGSGVLNDIPASGETGTTTDPGDEPGSSSDAAASTGAEVTTGTASTDAEPGASDGIGEACDPVSVLCGDPHLRCAFDGEDWSCVEDPSPDIALAVGEECGFTQHFCADGLFCVGGTCEQACRIDEDCPEVCAREEGALLGYCISGA